MNDNKHRSIILAKAGRWWVYEFVFAMKDRDSDKLAQFKLLAVVQKHGLELLA